MKTICLDPVTPQLLIAGSLSFVTVDRPPPVGWIGQRVAIYADKRTPAWLEAIWPPNLPADASKALQPYGERVVMDAIVGSGTLVEALPIYGPNTSVGVPYPHLHVYGDHVLGIARAEGQVCEWLPDGTYQLQDWSPGRWALRFTDVAPTSEQCPLDACWEEGGCICAPTVAPVLSGDDPTYREWTP